MDFGLLLHIHSKQFGIWPNSHLSLIVLSSIPLCSNFIINWDAVNEYPSVLQKSLISIFRNFGDESTNPPHCHYCRACHYILPHKISPQSKLLCSNYCQNKILASNSFFLQTNSNFLISSLFYRGDSLFRENLAWSLFKWTFI